MQPSIPCTAPCIPPCCSAATFTLLNMKSRSVLGFNCDQHLQPLIKKGGDSDYDKAALPDDA